MRNMIIEQGTTRNDIAIMGKKAENRREMAIPVPSSPEQIQTPAPSKELSNLIVAQPEKLGSLLDTIESLTNPQDATTEKQGENSGGSQTSAATGTTVQTIISSRDQAIANIPPQEKMQQALHKYINAEVRKLRREAALLTISRPGTAYRINQIYANIRRLNKLLQELIHASYETVKHFFIRIFIDRQPIL